MTLSVAGGDDTHVVGDEQDRHVEALAERVDQVEDLRLDGDVERRRRLVRYQQLRLARQGHGDHHTLAHAAGKLVRVLGQPFLGPGHADKVEYLDSTFEGFLLRRPPMDPDRFGYLATDGPCRVERGHRVLEDHRDLVAADPAHFSLIEADQVAAVEPDRPTGDVADLGRSFSTDRPIVVLPQPDSPTRPKHSPLRTENETVSTARAVA